MGKVLTTGLLCIFSLLVNNVFAGNPKYGKVLYRVNAGGVEQASLDTSSVPWSTDNSANPSPYIDIVAMGNKTYGTTDAVTFDASVPATVPNYVFKIERDLYNGDVDSLEYHFPVAYGKKVEVRLYFAEIYFDAAGLRIFDIFVENNKKLGNYDIFAEVGKNVGVMKSYTATSDGMLNIFLSRVTQLPKINGIEIIEIIEEVEENELQTLYRVNAGGTTINAIDANGLPWVQDDFHIPSDFVDTIANGNKTFITTESLTMESDVPVSTPLDIFKSERDLGRWDVKDLVYNFPVPAGQKVDVRLYFAEIYYDNAGARVMDVIVEDKLMASHFDIFAEAGKLNGVIRTYTVLSDGLVTIKLRRVVQQPKINGIEILESTKDVTIAVVAGLFNSKPIDVSISAYPNPLSNETAIDLGDIKPEFIRVYDSFGKEISMHTEYIGSIVNFNFTNFQKGIYYIQLVDTKNTSHSIKIIKE